MAKDARPRARVLIVDDNLELAENIAEILGFEGYTTLVSGSAEEALPNALSDEVEVVVTDFRLPGMTGPELIERVRQLGKQVHALVVSALTDEGTVRAAHEAGARFLSKPVDLALLSQLMRDMVAA
jgi:CheY-like chemotaxis protein